MFNPSDTPQMPMSPPNTVLDVSADTFLRDVIDASEQRLVVVDFSSPRNSMCKRLTPLLEKLVCEEKGAARLAKVNIDQQPQLAQQMQLESVPTVFAFFQGKILDGFVGLLSEPQIKTWLQKLIKTTGSKPENGPQDDVQSALDQAEEHFNQGDMFTAKAIYDDILDYAPEEPRAFLGGLRCLMGEGKIDQAQKEFDALPLKMTKNKAFDSLRTALELACQTKDKQGQTESLKNKVAANPNDHQSRFDLALAYYSEQKLDKAIDALLEIITRDRKWNEEAARKQLLKLFDVLGTQDQLTIDSRKRLSSILFS